MNFNFSMILLWALVVISLLFPPSVISEELLGEETITLDSLPQTSPLNRPNLLEEQEEQPLNARIVSLLALSEENPQQALRLLPKIEAMSTSFNAAEKYLMFVVKANIADVPGQEHKVINWLNQALMLESQISTVQLQLPMFNKSYLTLAENYAIIGNFKQAYDKKSEYNERFYHYRMTLKDKRLQKLNKKYDTDIKLKENKLLQSQHEFEAIQLQKTEERNVTQQRNIVILIVTALVFVVLLFRQLRIRSILRKLAKTDSLTGLSNRKTLFKQGNKLFKTAIDQQKNLSVILFDIDYFKNINDSYGHQTGDEMIKAVSSLGTEIMRSRDVFSRLGGEEFAAILPDTTLDQAKAFAERLKEKVESFSLPGKEIKVTVTISAGVANTSQIQEDFDSLLNAADQAMYSAKNAGRNHVCCFHPQK